MPPTNCAYCPDLAISVALSLALFTASAGFLFVCLLMSDTIAILLAAFRIKRSPKRSSDPRNIVKALDRFPHGRPKPAQRRNHLGFGSNHVGEIDATQYRNLDFVAHHREFRTQFSEPMNN